MSNGPSRRRVLAGSALLGTTALAGRLPRDAAAAPTKSPNAERTPSDTAPESVAAETSSAGRIGIQPPQEFDLEGLESFVDERMDDLLEAHDVVGASVAVVHDGAVEHLAGYGRADTEDGTPVDPAETGFRIASVSKPIVWTALMQLIEDGEIDPDEDARNYLESVSIPETYDELITVAHLATHTAGFEERARGTWVVDPEDLRPLPDVLDEEQPARVRPPGEVAAYSNYGTALAGQVVADVADTSFETYAAENVFAPLGMASTTFDQPVPDAFDATVATGYTAFAGTTQPVPDLLLEIGPAGGATSTAADMAQFLRAHLEGGAVGGDADDIGNGTTDEADGTDADGRILESESVDAMHERWFSHHEAIDGVGFGLIEGERNGVRTLEHDGAIPGSFTSFFLLVPGYDLGVFVATNTNTGALATGEFLEAFFDEYLPGTANGPEDGGDGETDGNEPGADGNSLEPDGQPDRADELEGTYRGVRVAETSHARLSTTAQAGSVDVSVDEEGYLVTDFGGGPDRWVEREPLVFEAVDDDDTLAFREVTGEIRYLCLGFHAFERVSRLESLSTHGGLAAATTLGMLSGIAVWPLSWAKRRFVDPPTDGHENAANADRVDVDRDDIDSSREDERRDSSEISSESDSSGSAETTSRSDSGRSAETTSGSDPGGSIERTRAGETRGASVDATNGDETVDGSAADWRSRLTPSPTARPRWLVAGVVACLFGYVLGVVVLAFFVYPYTLFSRPPFVYDLLSVLPIIGAVGTVAAAGYAALVWRDGYWGRLSRIHYAVVVASAAGFCWLLWYWNFLRFPF
ncbi:serine hydrolase domain-containing protein [Natrarchaeobius sp. A-rgal3]|uniref:serine hydrolase domain-containing protein n=1 Tax=Natrarchaeobius versutus TaxID=1679078 RepID=UPI0035109D43